MKVRTQHTSTNIIAWAPPLRKKQKNRKAVFRIVERPQTTNQLDLVITVYTQPIKGKTPNFTRRPNTDKARRPSNKKPHTIKEEDTPEMII